MKKLLLFIVLSVTSILTFPQDQGYDYERLYDHQWYKVYFYEPEYVPEYVLVRLNGNGRWTVKRYINLLVIHFKDIINKEIDIFDVRVDDCPDVIGDYRISFICDQFPKKLAECDYILGIKKAY